MPTEPHAAGDAPDRLIEVAVIGAGPAGLRAAEVLSQQGHQVEVFDAMPSAGRKFLLAGVGGLNLTHAEARPQFIQRYGEQQAAVARWLERFGPEAIRDWTQGLGIETFVGSSSRVFPQDMKAAPLLRAWLHRLRHAPVPVQFHMRHRWLPRLERSGDPAHWALGFDTPLGRVHRQAMSVVLALGGASWPRLGSDGQWQAPLSDSGIGVSPLRPSNCGFDVQVPQAGGDIGTGWSSWFRSRFAGHPLKSIRLSCPTENGAGFSHIGEAVLTETGLEGSLVYAASAHLRHAIERSGRADLHLHLKPQWSNEQIQQALERPRGKDSWSNHLRRRVGLGPVHMALIREALGPALPSSPAGWAHAIQALPLQFGATRPIDEAISSAGGVRLDACNGHLMLLTHPGVFCAGEMLDWEAPTGGYLLTACLASGQMAADGVHAYLGPRGHASGSTWP